MILRQSKIEMAMFSMMTSWVTLAVLLGVIVLLGR